MRFIFRRTGDGKLVATMERVGPGMREKQLRAEDMLVPTPSDKDEFWRPTGTDCDAPRVR